MGLVIDSMATIYTHMYPLWAQCNLQNRSYSCKPNKLEPKKQPGRKRLGQNRNSDTIPKQHQSIPRLKKVTQVIHHHSLAHLNEVVKIKSTSAHIEKLTVHSRKLQRYKGKARKDGVCE